MKIPKNNSLLHSNPVAIGGIGGSGTRLIAQILIDLGYNMGSDLNGANDNLWFTLVFKRLEILSTTEEEFDILVNIFISGMLKTKKLEKSSVKLLKRFAANDRPTHSSSWLNQRITNQIKTKQTIPRTRKWGWKEPNTHIVIDRLSKRLPNMKYIHVMRNGLDMAFSKNQNQLKLWGTHHLSECYNISPASSLKYWCEVQKRVIDIGSTMGNNFYLLNYDQFCSSPESELMKLMAFLGHTSTNEDLARLSKLISPPTSLGRYKSHGLSTFSKEDINYVQSLGFNIE